MQRENIKRARTHIVFLLALLSGSVLIYFLNGVDMETKGYSKRDAMEITAPSIGVTETSTQPTRTRVGKNSMEIF
ncbi:MAG: hypothetical protein Q9M36_01715 [Sulfurovum sp.]|nr:hypothetical protein [Sulfurovum sp.]